VLEFQSEVDQEKAKIKEMERSRKMELERVVYLTDIHRNLGQRKT